MALSVIFLFQETQKICTQPNDKLPYATLSDIQAVFEGSAHNFKRTDTHTESDLDITVMFENQEESRNVSDFVCC